MRTGKSGKDKSSKTRKHYKTQGKKTEVKKGPSSRNSGVSHCNPTLVLDILNQNHCFCESGNCYLIEEYGPKTGQEREFRQNDTNGNFIK